jgi:hypothetical protein
MPKKYVRKFLPSHESVRGNRYVGILGSALQHPNLWHLNRRSVAGGVAIGMLCGMIPGPIQMLCAAALAIVLRVNLPVAMTATWYSNPFTIVPLERPACVPARSGQRERLGGDLAGVDQRDG